MIKHLKIRLIMNIFLSAIVISFVNRGHYRFIGDCLESKNSVKLFL
jgi:hypothetical protein